jgi:hypothetical protein
MPVIPRAAPKPLPPEGPAKLHVMDVTFGRSKEKKTAFFELLLRDLNSGLTLKDRVYLTEGSAWKADALCRSMGHTLPDGRYRLQIDDLVNRLVYGCIVHQTLPSGITTAQMKTYWRHDWAIQQDDKLADIPDPKGVLGPVELPLVEETSTPVESIAPSPPKQEPPPAAKAAPVTPPNTRTPAGEAKATPEADDLAGISDAELAEAFAYAKKLRAQKEQKPGE